MESDKILSKLFQLDKTPVKFYIVTTILGTIIFLGRPKSIVSSPFFIDYEAIIMIVYLVFLVFLLVTISYHIYYKFDGKQIVKKKEKKQLENILNLSEEEKVFLNEFIIQNASSVNLPSNNAAVSKLEHKGIIHSPFYMRDGFTSYTLNMNVRNIIEKHQLNLNTGRRAPSMPPIRSVQRKNYW